MATTSVSLQDAGLTFQKAGLEITKKVHDNVQVYGFDQVIELSNKAQDLLIKSKTLFAQSVIMIGEEAKESLQSLTDAKQDINDTIKRIVKVQSLVDFTTKLVAAASAVLSGDVQKIIATGKAVMKDVQNLTL